MKKFFISILILASVPTFAASPASAKKNLDRALQSCLDQVGLYGCYYIGQDGLQKSAWDVGQQRCHAAYQEALQTGILQEQKFSPWNSWGACERWDRQ